MPYKSIEINPTKYSSRHTAQQSQFYRGFSTVDNSKADSRLYDFELVKQDLLNQFNVRKNERVMNPNFGTIIWDTLYEPLTEPTKEEIVNDVRRIVSSDPRANVLDVKIVEQDYGLLIEITMLYNDTDQSEVLKLNFDKATGIVTV